jgi:hypothetical protein
MAVGTSQFRLVLVAESAANEGHSAAGTCCWRVGLFVFGETWRMRSTGSSQFAGRISIIGGHNQPVPGTTGI